MTEDVTIDLHPRTPDELRAGLRRLYRLVAGREPTAVRTGVISVEDDRGMVPGNTALAVVPGFVVLPSGLMAPRVAAPRPLDVLGVYITGMELLGVRPSLAYTEDQLRRQPFSEVLRFIATTLLPYRRLGSDEQAADLRFAEQWLAGEALQRARNLLRQPHRRLVVPQALYVLAKIAAYCSPDVVPNDVEPGNLAAALFGAVEVLENPSMQPRDDGDELVVDTAVSALSSYMIANHHLNQPLDADHLMARFVRQWLELPVERADDKQVLDLERTFHDVTGVHLQDFLAVALLLWAHAENGMPYTAIAALQTSLRWPTERLDSVLDLFCTDPAILRRELQKEVDRSVVWAFDILGRYPVVRLEDRTLLVVDPHLLLRRIYGGLTLFDITAPLKERRNSGSRRLAGRVESCVQHLAEVYALEVLTSLAGSGPGNPRVYDDAALRGALARHGRRIADAAVDYGDAWVVIEITTSKLTRASVAASADALVADLDKLVGEVEQIDSTIAALRAEEPALTGAPAHPVRRFYPVLITADGFPINPVSTELLRNRVREKGVLTDADIAPLEIIDTVELTMLEALADDGGPSLRDVLAGKERAVFHRMSVRDYLLRERGYQPQRPARVQDLLDKAWEPALNAAHPMSAT